MNINIIMLAGKAGSGKDTLANYLIDKYSYTRYAFADYLKKKVSYKYNIPIDKLHTQEGKRSNIEINGSVYKLRDLLIKEALDKRMDNENYWVNIVLKEIKNNDIRQNNIVISDFRYPNEYYTLNRYFSNITTINIIREISENIDDKSETSLDNFLFDYIIENNDTIENLYNHFDNIINKN